MATPTSLVAAMPPVTPFVAPEEIERQRGFIFEARLGANESAFGPSPKTREIPTNPAHYSDPKAFLLKAALAKLHRTSPANIAVASGIDELLSLFCRVFAAPGETVVTTAGTYPTFAFGAQGAGNLVRTVPYQNQLDNLSEAARCSKIVYLANPDNPTGQLIPHAEVEALRQALPANCLLLLDEAYADFVPPADLPSFPPNDPNVVRLRTFSKAHGLAGYRVGYALTHPDHVATLDKIRLHFGVNGPGQAAALASLSDPDHLAEVVHQTAAGRQHLVEISQSLGLRTFPSATNFVLFDTGDRTDALLESLLSQRVFVRKAATGGLRVTVGKPEELNLFEECLRQAISKSGG